MDFALVGPTSVIAYNAEFTHSQMRGRVKTFEPPSQPQLSKHRSSDGFNYLFNFCPEQSRTTSKCGQGFHVCSIAVVCQRIVFLVEAFSTAFAVSVTEIKHKKKHSSALETGVLVDVLKHVQFLFTFIEFSIVFLSVLALKH